MYERKFIVPPGLINPLAEFKILVENSGDDPILILGDTGVGKTLFLNVFKNLYEKNVSNKGKVVEANCSHFSGGASDLNIVRTEIFGINARVIGNKELKYISAQKKDKDGNIKGLVNEADKGVLILEEIGELPQEVQAMLLTFIER